MKFANSSRPAVLALDFDGVLCNGLSEYFQAAWQVYRQIWAEPSEPPPSLEAAFRRLRPMVETGWEMPVLLRALILGSSEVEIRQGETWRTQALATTRATPAELAAALDQVRDQWIVHDLPGWLGAHQFYAGVKEQLQALLASGLPVVIITTKEGRFTQQLLQQQGLTLPPQQVIGKERGQPKAQSLHQVQQTYQIGFETLWFVEDRLKTLQNIQRQPDLKSVRLFLAEWGYTTSEDLAAARSDPQVVSLSLERFCQDFTAWQQG